MRAVHSRSGSLDDYDPHLRQAIRVIKSTYGDDVSVDSKAKNLLKFGRSRAIGPDQKATVAVFQDTGTENEAFATGNTVDSLISNDTGNAGTIFTVEGHTLDTGGFTFNSQDVTCNGQTRVALSPTLARSTRMFTKPLAWPLQARSATGRVFVYDQTEATGVTGGTPDVPAATKVLIEGDTGDTIVDSPNQSEKLATTLSYQDYWICTEFYCAVTRDGPQSAKVDVEVEYRPLGGVWRPVGLELSVDEKVSGHMHDEMQPYVIIPKNSDVRMRAKSTIASTELSGYLNGYLAVVV